MLLKIRAKSRREEGPRPLNPFKGGCGGGTAVVKAGEAYFTYFKN